MILEQVAHVLGTPLLGELLDRILDLGLALRLDPCSLGGDLLLGLLAPGFLHLGSLGVYVALLLPFSSLDLLPGLCRLTLLSLLRRGLDDVLALLHHELSLLGGEANILFQSILQILERVLGLQLGLDLLPQGLLPL